MLAPQEGMNVSISACLSLPLWSGVSGLPATARLELISIIRR